MFVRRGRYAVELLYHKHIRIWWKNSFLSYQMAIVFVNDKHRIVSMLNTLKKEMLIHIVEDGGLNGRIPFFCQPHRIYEVTQLRVVH